MPGSSLQEYVIKLGSDVDSSGVQKVLSLLDSSKAKAVGVAAALTALTAVTYKAVESFTREEFELRKLAKQKNKDVETTRAQQEALKAMGMTLQDIKKDKALQDIYKDIEKTNKALALPNMDKALSTVRGLQGAFWKLTSTVSYVVDWIGAKVLTNLEAPINRIRDTIESISKWFRENLNSISTKVASYITGFAKGVIGIAESFKKIFEWVNDLPDGIKGIGAAVLGLWALLKSGPIGQIVAAVTMLGDVLHDYENFQWNKANPDKDPVGIAYAGLWEKLDSGDVGGMFDKLLSGLTEVFTKLSETLDSFDLGELLSDPESQIGGVITSITNWINDHQDQFIGLGQAFLKAVGSAFHLEGGMIVEVASDLISGIADVLRLDPEGKLEGIFKGNSIAEGISTAFFNSLLGMDPTMAIGSGILGMVDSVRDKLKEEFLKNGGDILGVDQFINDNFWNQLGIDFGSLAENLIRLIVAGIEGVENVGARIFEGIAKAIGTDTAAGKLLDTLGGENGETSAFGSALVDGLLAGFTTDSFIVGLGGFFGRIAAELGKEGGAEKLRNEARELGSQLVNLLFGEVGPDGGRKGGIVDAIINIVRGLWEEVSPYLDPFRENVRDFVENLAMNLWSWISPHIDTLGEKLKEWFEGIIDDIYKNGSPIVRAALEAVGYENSTSFEENGEGGFTLKNKSGTEYSGGTAAHYTDAAMEFIKNVAPYISLTENGEIDTSERISKNGIHTGMKLIQGVMGGISPVSLMDIVSDVIKTGSMPTDNAGNEFSWETIRNQYNRFVQEGYKIPTAEAAEPTEVPVALDTTEAESNLNRLKNMVQREKLYVNVDVGTDNDGEGKAWGGRIGTRMNNLTVGEDGTEYIIPITKPDRALSLITQMFGEMGTSVLGKVMDHFGLGQSGTVGSSLGGVASAMQGMVINNNYNVSAPVSIVVNSSASAEDVGTTAYNLAERHLMRTLRGVYA